MDLKRAFIRSACFVMLFGTTNGFACSWDRSLTMEDLYSQAASVFVAHLTKTEEANQASDHEVGAIEGTFRVIEVLKGQPPADGKIRSEIYSSGSCTLPLISGLNYIFYVDNEENYIRWTDGSVALWNLTAPDAQQLLDKLRSFQK